MEVNNELLNSNSKLKDFLKSRFGWPMTYLEILSLSLFLVAGIIHCIIFNSYLSYQIVINDTNRYPLLKTLSILSPIFGFYGTAVLKLNQGFYINTFILIFLVLCPLVILIILISKAVFLKYISLSVVCIFIPVAVTGIHCFKVIRKHALEIIPAKIGEILIIVLNIMFNLLYNITISVLFIDETGLKDPFHLIEYASFTFFIILVILWVFIHSSVFKREINEIQRLRQEILGSVENSLRVQVILQANPGILKIESERFLNRNGNILASLGIIISLLGVEIGLISVITQYLHGEYPHKAIYLAIFYVFAVPLFTFGGVIFSSSILTLRDKYLVILLIFTFIPTIFIMWISYYLSTFNSTYYIGMVIAFGFPGSLAYWLSISMVFRYNKRTFQYFSSIACLVLAVPIGLILPFYLSGGMKSVTFWVILSLLLFFGVFLLFLWLVQFLFKMTKQLCLLLKEFEVFNSGHVSLYIYSISFILGYSLVSWRLFKNLYGTSSWTTGYLAGSYVILAMNLVNSLFIQRIKLYIRDYEYPEETIGEIIVGKNRPLNNSEISSKNLKIKSQILLLAVGTILTLCIAIPVISTGSSESAAVCIFIGGFVSTLVYMFLLELKFYLKKFGKKVISFILAFCWLFCLVPIIVLIPVTLSSTTDEAEQRDVTSWSIGTILLLFMVGVSIGSITLNLIFNQLEYEKIAKFCCSAVQETLETFAVKSNLVHLRGIYDNIYNTSSEAVKKVLIAKTVYTYNDFTGPDLHFSKELLTLREINKLKQDLTQPKERNFLGLSDFCKKIFGREEKSLIIVEPNISQEENGETSLMPDQMSDNWEEKFKEDVLKQEQIQIEVEKAVQFKASVGVDEKIDLDKVKEVRLNKKRKTQLMESKELHWILNNEDAKRTWLKSVFASFSSGMTGNNGEPWMNLTDLRNFIRLSGLSKKVSTAACDILYVSLTREYSSSSGQVRNTRVNFETFHSKLIPELERILHIKKGSDNQLIKEQLFPYIVNNLPHLQLIAPSEEENDSVIEISDRKEVSLIEKQEENLPQVSVNSFISNRKSFKMDIKTIKKLKTQKIQRARFSGLIKWFSKCSTAIFKSILTCCDKMFNINMISFKSEANEKNKPDIEKKEGIEERLVSPEWEEICKIIVEKFEEADKEIRKNQSGKTIHMNLNLNNLTGMIGHIAEIYSFSSLGFSSQVGWFYGSAFTRTSSVVLADSEYWVETYWTCLSCSIVFLLLLYPTFKLLKQGRLGLNKDFTVAKFPSPIFLLSKAIGVLASSLYLTIMCAFLSTFSCVYSSGSWHLMRYSSIVCFSNDHVPYFVLSIIGVICYYPTSTLIYPSLAYQDKALDIKFDTTYLVLESQGKVLIAGFAVFFAKENYIWLQLIVSIFVSTTLFLICLRMKPCLIESYNLFKTGGFLIPIWICTCALITYFTGYTVLPVVLLVVGIGLIVGGIVGVFWAIYGIKGKNKVEAVERNGISNVDEVLVIDDRPQSID